MDGTLNFLNQLEIIIDERLNRSNASESYVSTLAQSGLDRVLKKIGEESGEVIIAAKNNCDEELINESADLLFHLMILLRTQGVSLDAVVDTLSRRHNGP